MIKSYLLAPGPTPVPPEVLAAMALPIIHHRTPQFGAVLAEVQDGAARALRHHAGRAHARRLRHRRDGGGGHQPAARPATRSIVVNGGKFGERWTKICADLRPHRRTRSRSSGAGRRPRGGRGRARGASARRAPCYVQASETSTCVLHPVAAIAEITRERDTLLVVDGITAVGVLDLPMDELGIDVLITGSQKALMLPPGLAFVALSRARVGGDASGATLPRFYFDFKRERKGVAREVDGVDAGDLADPRARASRSQMMRAEGWANVYARHDRLARATRAGAEALGPPPARARRAEPGDDGRLSARRRRRQRARSATCATACGVTFAGGQDQLKGKIIRLAHLGYVGDVRRRDGARGARDGARGTSARRSSSAAASARPRRSSPNGLPAALRTPWRTASSLTDSLGPEGLAPLRAQQPGPRDRRAARRRRRTSCPSVIGGCRRARHPQRHQGDRRRARSTRTQLRVIGRAGIGVDNIDVAAATKRGIVVMNTPGGNNVTTAEHAIALMLALARHIPQAAAAVRAGEWERSTFDRHRGLQQDARRRRPRQHRRDRRRARARAAHEGDRLRSRSSRPRRRRGCGVELVLARRALSRAPTSSPCTCR